MTGAVRTAPRAIGEARGACLAETTDPTLLIPGSLGALHDDAYNLERQAGELDDASGLVSRRVTASWLGRAAARWDERRPQLAASLAVPAQVYRAAAQALRTHAKVIEWAREQVEVAISLWERGAAQVATPAVACRTPVAPLGAGLPWTSPLARSLRGQAGSSTPEVGAVVVGPGAVLCAQAERLVTALRAVVAESARSTADFLDECCADMPDGQFHLDQLGAGVWDWGWGLGEMAARFNTPRMLIDWDGFYADGEAMVTGSVDLLDQLAENPHDFNRLVLDSETFRDNPARWLGRIAPDLALSAVAGAGVVSKLGKLGTFGSLGTLGRSAARALDNLAGARAGARTARVFTSTDPLVGELASALDQAAPGSVLAVNRNIDTLDGHFREVDIELADMVIQVKSGPAGGLTGQILATHGSTGRTVVGYAPDMPQAAWANAARQGIPIARTEDELMAILAELS